MTWKKISSRVVFDNPWMSVLEDEVINPGGGRNNYGHVHFKNRAVAIVAMDQEQHIWLVGQSRYTLNSYSWELPMGGAPLDEAPLSAAQRELAEETGLRATEWHELLKLHPSNSITDEFGIAYLATSLSQGVAAPEQTEDISVRRVPLSEALSMIDVGDITDAISVAAILQASRKM